MAPCPSASRTCAPNMLSGAEASASSSASTRSAWAPSVPRCSRRRSSSGRTRGRSPASAISKTLSAKQRERVVDEIKRRSLAWGLGAASVAEIERINIRNATHLAMRRALRRIGDYDHVLVDGMKIRGFEEHIGPYTAIVDGDASSYAIACASVIAKVTRDRLMARLAVRYPGYGWEHNAGYATRDHVAGLREHGVTRVHRKTYQRIRAILEGDQLALDLLAEEVHVEVDGDEAFVAIPVERPTRLIVRQGAGA